ncbi:hypothetical protein B0H17DRAFT_1148030 [Mycena rosella]|uniref:Uncharacterized protein n=1 Tax=Mycena rosella TaxID=1033263 RepID=A0AAD7G000_MYCRO|nr:hypothetical protein B0H17DRAFT_1148030 [Mycena rosella]
MGMPAKLMVVVVNGGCGEGTELLRKAVVNLSLMTIVKSRFGFTDAFVQIAAIGPILPCSCILMAEAIFPDTTLDAIEHHTIITTISSNPGGKWLGNLLVLKMNRKCTATFNVTPADEAAAVDVVQCNGQSRRIVYPGAMPWNQFIVRPTTSTIGVTVKYKGDNISKARWVTYRLQTFSNFRDEDLLAPSVIYWSLNARIIHRVLCLLTALLPVLHSHRRHAPPGVRIILLVAAELSEVEVSLQSSGKDAMDILEHLIQSYTLNQIVTQELSLDQSNIFGLKVGDLIGAVASLYRRDSYELATAKRVYAIIAKTIVVNTKA